MNPGVSRAVIAAAYLRDSIAASAEYGAEFRTDLAGFITREIVEARVVPGRHELPPRTGISYYAFVDPSGGSSDAFTLAISHEERKKSVLDLVREVRPPFSPESVVGDFAAELKRYRVSTVVGDAYAGEWPREQFRKLGITYKVSEMNRSELYLELLPGIMSDMVELLDHPRLVQQLCTLERRTARSGKDSVDHPPGSHDDVANACAGALVLAMPSTQGVLGVVEYGKKVASGEYANPLQFPNPAAAMKSTKPEQAQACPKCESQHIQRVAGRRRCADCGEMFGPLPEAAHVKRSDVLAGHYPVTRR
jgi:hypothetical protein